MIKDIDTALNTLGLTQYEAKIYRTIATEGASTAKDISNICGIPYGKTYEVINSLVNRGFAVVLPVKPMKYKPVDCGETLRILQSNLSKELEHAKNVFSSLKEKQKEIEVHEPRGSFWVLHGRSAINNKIENLIRKSRKSIMLFLSGNAIYRMMYFRELLEQKKKEGVDISVITTKSSDEGICSLWSCSFCDEQNMNTKSNFVSVDGQESIIFESVPDDKNYTTGTDIGISIIEKSTTSFLESMFSVFNTYRHLLMSSTNAIFIIDAETMEVIEANSQCSKIIGFGREALVGKNIKDIAKQLGMVSQSFFDSSLKKIKKEKSVNIKDFEIDIGNNAITANVSAHIQKFYGKDAIVINVTDVTHEKQIEHEKTTISERYSYLFHTLPLPALLLSKDDKVLMVNKAVEEEFSFNFNEKKDVSIYNFVPKDRHAQMKKIRKMSQKKAVIIKLPLVTPKGIREFIIFLSKADSDGNKIVIGKDISELQDLKRDKKEIQKELKSSEDKYKILLESLNEGIWAIDKEDYTTFVNPKLAEMMGYLPEDMIGKHLFSFMDKEAIALCKNLLNNRKDGKKENHEFEFFKKDSSIIHVYMNTVPIFDKKGNYDGALASVTDISGKKHAEEQLKESECRYRTLFESSSDAIMTLAPPTWSFTEGNLSTLKMFQAKDESEFASKGPWELSPKYQPDGQLSSIKAKKMIMKAMEECSNFFEWTHKRVDGEEFPATVLLTKVKLGDKEQLQATVRDISKQKKVEEKLSESEEKYKTIVESATDQIFMLDTKLRFVSVNTAAANMSHHTPEELIGKYIFDIFPKETVIRFSKNCKEVLETSKSKFIEEKMVVNGKDFYNNTILNPVKDSKGNIVAVMGIVRDVTEQQRLEKESLESRAKYKYLFDNVKAGAFCSSLKDGKILDVNRHILNMFGYEKKADVIGRHVTEFYASLEERKELINRVKKEGIVIGYPVTMNKKDGTKMRLDVSLCYSPYDETIIGIFRETSDKQI